MSDFVMEYVGWLIIVVFAACSMEQLFGLTTVPREMAEDSARRRRARD